MLPIVWDNFMRYPIFTNDISLNKLSNFVQVQNLMWGSFHPFSKIINSNKYEFIAIGCCWVNLPNNIYSLCREWPGWSHGMQRHRWHVLQISIDLALIAFSNMSHTIGFHSSPVVSLSSLTTCVHSYMTHSLTHEPLQFSTVLPWRLHKGGEFHHIIFCKAFHHK